MNIEPKFESEYDYDWICSQLSSSVIEEELLLFLYDWSMYGNDSPNGQETIMDEVLSKFLDTKNLPEFYLKYKDTPIYHKYLWVFNNLGFIYLMMTQDNHYLSGESQLYVFELIEELIITYLEWRDSGKDFNVYYNMVEQYGFYVAVIEPNK